MGLPWYSYPRVDNFGTIDPAGPYWKPDSNIQLPGNYPITALLPGTVTAVQQTSWGQNIVTIKLDNPLNNLATHTFYEHMSGSTVQVGQHVQAGDLIGYNNSSGQVPLGFGLYSGDIYGSGADWSVLQKDLAPGGAGYLNPVALLNRAMGGNLPSGTHSSSSTGSGNTLNWQSQFHNEGIKIGLFLLAFVLTGFGFYLIFEKQGDALLQKGVDAAKKAAVMAA